MLWNPALMPGLLALFALSAMVASLEIDNSLTGEPIVDCQDTQVSLTFNTQKPFSGRIYVKGLSDDNRCSRSYAANSDQDKFTMIIGQGDCQMGRRRVFGEDEPIEGLVFSLVIVVSFHGTFVTKADRAFRCMCFFRNIKRVTNLLDMSMIGTTELLDTMKMPTCEYEIRSGSQTGPLARYAKIGDKIFHTWKCDDPEQGFLVHSCWVNDGRGNRFDLLDIDGCAIDPIIQPDVSYDPELTSAWVETHGYKFSDTSVLDYMCVLELCKKAQGECNGVTPPSCGRGRKRRQTDTLLVRGARPLAREEKPHRGKLPELDITAEMQVIDTLGDEENVDGSLMESLNSRVYAAESKDTASFCLSPSAFAIGLATTGVLAVAALTAVVMHCFRRK